MWLPNFQALADAREAIRKEIEKAVVAGKSEVEVVISKFYFEEIYDELTEGGYTFDDIEEGKKRVRFKLGFLS